MSGSLLISRRTPTFGVKLPCFYITESVWKIPMLGSSSKGGNRDLLRRGRENPASRAPTDIHGQFGIHGQVCNINARPGNLMTPKPKPLAFASPTKQVMGTWLFALPVLMASELSQLLEVALLHRGDVQCAVVPLQQCSASTSRGMIAQFGLASLWYCTTL